MCTLPLKSEHSSQAFDEHVLAWLARARSVVLKESGENFREVLREATELDENGRQQVTDILLATIPEIEIKHGNCAQSHFTYVMDLLDYR